MIRHKVFRVGKGVSKPILVGSTYFFKTFKDFNSKDIDYIVIVDEPSMFNIQMNVRLSNKDVFYWKKAKPSKFIELALNSDPLCSGKFLVPEFNREIGFTFDMLPMLKEKFENMDTRHLYETAIYNAYIENGDFLLTEEQRKLSYDIYKENKK